MSDRRDERYQSLFESVQDLIFVRAIRPDGPPANFTEVNSAACKWLGFTKEELRQKSPLDVNPDLSAEQVAAREKQVLKEGCATFQTTLLTKDNRVMPVEITSHRFDWNGEHLMISIARDLANRDEANAALRESERRFREMMENVRLIAIMLDADGKILFANQFLLELAGWSREEVIGEDWFTLFLPKDTAAKVRRVFGGLMQETPLPHYTNEIVTRHGERRLIAWNNTYLKDGAGNLTGLASIGEDITERKRAEQALLESELRFRQLAENIEHVFWISDKNKSEVLYVSPAYERIWGRPCQSLYDEPGSFAKSIHPEDRARVLAALEREKRGQDYDEEYRIERPDGSMRWIHDRGFAVRNADGEFYRLAGLAEDITERRQLSEQLRQAQKLEAIGQLAGGVAHDFNNILAAILMQMGLLQQSPQLTIGMNESIKEVENEAMRAASLTRQLLLFSRRQAARIEPLNINSLTNDLLKMLRRVLGENIRVHFQALNPLWVRADPGMIEQVVMNLCINARDAMPQGGDLRLSADPVHVQGSSRHPEGRPGEFVCLTVADTGHGMAPSVLNRLFEPFFTTKEVGKGTGLGLATVYGIVRQHEGWIEVESVVGTGSSFRVYFPALTQTARKAGAIEDAGSALGGAETILLVEDDLSLRRTTALCLRALGYAVYEASSEAEAMSLWRQHWETVDLLLTDMIMPDTTTGLDLATALKAEKPSLKVIISSGYSMDLSRLELHGQPVAYLPKPFKPLTLAKMVRECLDLT